MRIVTAPELAAISHYAEVPEMATIFNHEVVEVEGVFRWMANPLIEHIDRRGPFYTGDYRWDANRPRGCIDMNQLLLDLYARSFTIESYMKFYMQIGYSICGFLEFFGQKEASELGLEDARDGEDAIDWVIRRHKGTVLKL